MDNSELLGIKGNALRVFLVISDYVHDVNPTIELIAKETALSERQVRRYVLTLQEKGLVTIKRTGLYGSYSLYADKSILNTQKQPKPTPQYDDNGKDKIINPIPGDSRLIVNIRQDLHKKLKMAAVDQGTTIGKIIERLVEGYL